jgi:hypothetical protein
LKPLESSTAIAGEFYVSWNPLRMVWIILVLIKEK